MAGLRNGIALALSGGGFRATLFHAGALIRLNECALLEGLDCISAVSGGSIAAARLAVAWPRLGFVSGVATNLRTEVIDPLRDFCSRDVDRRAVAIGTLSPFSTVGDTLERIYADELVEGADLRSLPRTPRFIFNATNLRTGRLVRISGDQLADYRIGRIPDPDLPLARAVAASSAFPPALSPVIIDTSGMAWEHTRGADLFNDPGQRGELQLTDGGVYDNLGLEAVDDFSTILASDAGAPFATGGEEGVSWLRQPMRALDIATDQSRGLRKRHLIGQAAAHGQKVAIWAIDTVIGEYAVTDALPTLSSVTGPLARIRTRLDPFDGTEQGRLLNWGYALADASARAYLGVQAPPPVWPVPEHRLDDIDEPRGKS